MEGKEKETQYKSIVITGDVTVDNFIYEGKRFSARMVNIPGVRQFKKGGGAILTFQILTELITKSAKINPEDKNNISKHWKIIPPGFDQPEKEIPSSLCSYSLWSPFKINNSKSVWRMSRALGYGNELMKPNYSQLVSKKEVSILKKAIPKILVIDDAGYQFGIKSQESQWKSFGKYDWIILKMTGKVAADDLWTELIKKYSNKLIVILSAAEMRGEDYQIARGTSWEQTIEDTENVLLTAHNISNLTKCRHLIISYNNDGVLWLNKENQKTEARLLCDTTRAENEWSENIPGKSFGYLSCLTSAVTFNLIGKGKNLNTSDFINGIESGLSAMRNLLEFGHGDAKDIPTGFPYVRIADEILSPCHSLSCFNIPWPHTGSVKEKRKWMITEMLQRSPLMKENVSLNGLARQVILYGTKILDYVPHAKFRKHATADRLEIESLRSIRHFMLNYRNNLNVNKPISFGVFGPPGAGKSFGVKQIAYEIFGEKSWLEFNLSQFTCGSLQELHGAFHQVRDKVLAGLIPVVFMDEFDSKQYEWLQYLLSPMQDGEFQEGQLTHSIGKCIFIFAGATSYSFESFGKFKDDNLENNAKEHFILKKGPDFKSRLDTYLDVFGPNQKQKVNEKNILDPSDTSFALRRAIFIASKIKYDSYLPAKVDPGLINALLCIPKYIHGARSLDKLLSLLLSPDGSGLERTRIPADSQLSVYVDPIEFNRLLSEPGKNKSEIPIEEIAIAIHTYWMKMAGKLKNGTTEEYNKLFELLDEEGKEDNRAAARRIQDIVSAVNLNVERFNKSNELSAEKKKLIEKHIEFHIELLSALEHNGWWMQRINTGWVYSEKRDNKKKHHHLLIPYSKLPNFEKEKDRQSVRNFQKILNSNEFQINWIE